MTQCFTCIRPSRFLRAAALVALAVLTACSGCASSSKKWSFASWDVRKAVGWKKDEKPEPQVPARLVATWTETVLNKAGQKPQRGFGGRLVFFNRESEDPLRVDGQLVVYAFDETSRSAYETEPTRVFIFPADQLVLHESDSKLGASYSVWLPWDEVGGTQRNISLIARFEPRGGPIVMGEQTRHLLPGSALGPEVGPQFADVGHTEAGQAVRLAAYSTQATGAVPTLADEAASPPVAEIKQMTTATIALPPRLGSAVQQPQAPPQQQSQTTTLDPKSTARVPLSQLSTMKGQKSVLAPAGAPAAPPVAAAANALSGASSTPAPTTAAPPRPGHLRDSLLESLRAQATPDARGAPGRAR